MSKYRRAASMLLGGATLALTSVVGLGGSAQATTGAEILVPIAFPGAYALPRTFTAGDCRQVGQNQAGSQIPSLLTITKSTTIQDHYTIAWYGTLYTVQTLRWDVWHAKFTFRSSSGPLFTIAFEGPVMREGTIYHVSNSADVVLTADEASQIHFVDWIGDC
jgi:hypothetical protein